MAWTRIPRKTKKALKQLEVPPRRKDHGWFYTIQFGFILTHGKRTKWTSKAKKVLRGKEGTKYYNWICNKLSSITPNFSKVARDIEGLYFTWDLVSALK